MSANLRSKRTPRKPAKFQDFDTPLLEAKKPHSPEKKMVQPPRGKRKMDTKKREDKKAEKGAASRRKRSRRGEQNKVAEEEVAEELEEVVVKEEEIYIKVEKTPGTNLSGKSLNQDMDIEPETTCTEDNDEMKEIEEEIENFEEIDNFEEIEGEIELVEEVETIEEIDEKSGELEAAGVKVESLEEILVEVKAEEHQSGRTKLTANTQVFVPYTRDDGVTGLKQCVVVQADGEVYLDDVKLRAVQQSVQEKEEVSKELVMDDAQTEAETAEQLLRLSQETGREEGADDAKGAEEEESQDSLVCRLCGRTFASEKSKRTHQRMRCRKRPLSDQRPFKCKVCGIGRITKDDLRKHSLVHETKVKEVGGSFKCKDCAKEFTTSVKYERHMLTHSASAASVCLICGKDCRKDSKYSLEEHMNWHAMHPIECTLCEVQLKEASQFNEHKLKHPDERVFRCVAIGSESVLAEEMRKTLAEWHVQDKKEFPCEFCGKTFQRKASRADHVRIHTGEKPHTCSICNRSFTLKNTLKMHMMRHEGIKPHTCETCGKQFLSRFMLNEHKRIHTGEKPFSCDICGKTFSTRPNLCAHVKLHTGARPYQCSYCESAFTSKAKMRMHEDSHRGEIKHFCPYCNKGFIRKDSMISHQRIHRIKRKSCACELCGNRYSSPAALKVHLRKHQVVKPFECSICGKPYTRSDVWKKHLEWHRKRMVPDSHLEVISVPHEAEGGDVQIVVDDDVHIVVDQKTEGGVERVEIPLSVIVNGDNTAMAVPENAEISIIRKNSFGESTIQELHELVTQ